MDRCFMWGCAPVPHSSNDLACLSLQVSYSIYKIISPPLPLLYMTVDIKYPGMNNKSNRLSGKWFTAYCICWKVPDVLQSKLLASFQTGSTGGGASCNQAGCDRSAVGPVLDGDVQSVG